MRRFSCDRCSAEVSFHLDRCGSCDAALGYLPDDQRIHVVTVVDDLFAVNGVDGTRWRCLNHAWGCNWMLPADTGTVWCASCRLTRGRPDTTLPRAVEAWSTAEAAKRRLVHQLITLGLPLEPAGPDDVRLVFDLVDMPSGGGVTGHLEGLVTLDLREVDDSYREATRRRLGESFRTPIGHLRHEVGHHYWRVLVRTHADLDEVRRVFGDERADYASSLEHRYSSPMADATSGFVTSYAMAHPAEDWAETFAHYLHLRDGLETAGAYGIEPPPSAHDEARIDSLLKSWNSVVAAISAIEEGLGQPHSYPFRLPEPAPSSGQREHSGPAPDLVAKFAIIHRLVQGPVPNTNPFEHG